MWDLQPPRHISTLPDRDQIACIAATDALAMSRRRLACPITSLLRRPECSNGPSLILRVNVW